MQPSHRRVIALTLPTASAAEVCRWQEGWVVCQPQEEGSHILTACCYGLPQLPSLLCLLDVFPDQNSLCLFTFSLLSHFSPLVSVSYPNKVRGRWSSASDEEVWITDGRLLFTRHLLQVIQKQVYVMKWHKSEHILSSTNKTVWQSTLSLIR